MKCSHDTMLEGIVNTEEDRNIIEENLGNVIDRDNINGIEFNSKRFKLCT